LSEIAIEINVRADKLTSAKRAILDTSAALDDLTKRSNVNLDLDAKSNIPNLVNEMMDAMRRMENIGAKATKNGGLKIGESDTAANLLNKYKSDAAAYEQALGKIGKSLDALYEKKKKLESVPFTSPSWEKSQEELKTVNKDYSERTAGYEKMQAKYDPRFDRARSGSDQAMGEIAGAATLGSGSGMSLTKIMGTAAALFGGFSIMGFLNNSRQQYRGMSDAESLMTTRGIGFERGLSSYGYGPAEEAEIALSLNRSTGYRSMTSTRMAERFSRAAGTDVSTSVGFLGGIYGYSGMSSDKQGRLTDVVVALKENSKDKRIEEILKLINGNLGATFAAQGGKALNESQIANIMATTMGLYNKAGTMGNSSELFSTLQGGLRMGGGDTAGEIMKWQVMGGFDGPMTATKMVEMQRMQDRGLTDPALRDKTMAMIMKAPGRANQNLMLQRMLYDGFNKPGGSYVADTILDLFGPAGGLSGANDPSKTAKIFEGYITGNHVDPAISGEVAHKLGIYSNTPGAKLQGRKAQTELLHLVAGEDLEKVFGKFEDVALNTAGDILNSNLLKQTIEWADKGGAAAILSYRGVHTDPLIRSVSKQVGIDPELLRSVMAVESGFNPKAISKKGAKGLMQLMPGTAKDYGVKDIFDPAQNAKAGATFLKAMINKYNGDEEKALAAYNWGPVNVDNKGMSAIPKETREYVSQVMGIHALRIKEAPKEQAPIVGTEDGSFLGYLGLFREMVVSLQKIAANTSVNNLVPSPLPGPPR
jgi:hypothetical protein